MPPAATAKKSDLPGQVTERTQVAEMKEPKYGKDFKIPELPPLLQEQLFGGPTVQENLELLSQQQSQMSALQNTTFSPSS